MTDRGACRYPDLVGARDTVGVLEEIYRVERTPDAWLASVTKALAARFDRRDGTFGYFVDCSGGGFRAWGLTSTRLRPDLEGVFEAWNADVDVATKRTIHTYAPCGTSATIPAATQASPLVRSLAAAWSVAGINAIDASHAGCAFAMWSPAERSTPSEALIAEGTFLSAHLSAAARLLRKLGGEDPLATADAVMLPGGKVVHASRDARSEAARAALRSAARTSDRLRSSGLHERPEDVLRAWSALVAARWTLVDHFDTDGRRYVVVQRNVPTVPRTSLLSARERQIARAAALGHSNKLIAYELGLTASTVAKHLARAAAKLGVRTRVELIRVMLENDPGAS